MLYRLVGTWTELPALEFRAKGMRFVVMVVVELFDELLVTCAGLRGPCMGLLRVPLAMKLQVNLLTPSVLIRMVLVVARCRIRAVLRVGGVVVWWTPDLVRAGRFLRLNRPPIVKGMLVKGLIGCFVVRLVLMVLVVVSVCLVAMVAKVPTLLLRCRTCERAVLAIVCVAMWLVWILLVTLMMS